MTEWGNGPIFPEDEKRIKHLKDMLNKMKKHEEDFAKEFEKAKKGKIDSNINHTKVK